MTERTLPSPADQQRPATWEPEPLAQALNATIRPIQDLALGAGQRLTLHSAPTHVDLFAAGRAAQIVASEAHLLLIVAGQEPPIIAGEQIIFAGPGRSLSLAASGEIRLTIIPATIRRTTHASEMVDSASSDGGGRRP